MKNLFLLLLTVWGVTAHASASRVGNYDIIYSTGGAQLTVPTVGSSFATDTNTITLQNKTISGSSNTFSNIPVSALATGTAIGVALGGTGDSTLTTNGMLFGNGTSPVGITAAGTQYQSFQAGASGVPTVGAIHVDQSAAVTGILGHANGGSDSSTLAGGAANFIAALSGCTTSGNYLKYNGTNYICASIPATAPALNGGSGSAQAVTAISGVSLSGITNENFVWVSGSGGAVTVTAPPNVQSGTADGQLLHIIGTSATNTLTLRDQAVQADSGLSLNGNWTGGKDSVLNLHWDNTQGLWAEDSRR